MAVTNAELEEAIARYLASFVHVDCGGAPVAYVGSARDKIGCTNCDLEEDGGGALGEALKRSRVFRSLRVAN